jgi:cell division protein FtsB
MDEYLPVVYTAYMQFSLKTIDSRKALLWGFAAVAIGITYSGAKTVQSNSLLELKIANMSQENENRQLENENNTLKNEYYSTPAYIELEQKRLYGKAAPGETVYTIGKDQALARVGGIQNSVEKGQTSRSKPASNIERWRTFLGL